MKCFSIQISYAEPGDEQRAIRAIQRAALSVDYVKSKVRRHTADIQETIEEYGIDKTTQGVIGGVAGVVMSGGIDTRRLNLRYNFDDDAVIRPYVNVNWRNSNTEVGLSFNYGF